MPTGRFPWGIGYLRPNLSQPGGANFSRFIRLPPVLSVEEILYIILSEYQSGQRAALKHGTQTAAEIATRGEASTRNKWL